MGANYTTSFQVDKSPAAVFAAINNVRSWWSGKVEGDTDKLGAEFVYSYEDVHHSTQKITELVPGKKIVWHVTEARLTFVKDMGEWKGTDIIFDIAEKDGKTEVTFTHVGLVPNFECYGACSNAWGLLINGNLREFINTGKTQPSPF